MRIRKECVDSEGLRMGNRLRAVIDEMLRTAKTIAVVGMSDKTGAPATTSADIWRRTAIVWCR